MGKGGEKILFKYKFQSYHLSFSNYSLLNWQGGAVLGQHLQMVEWRAQIR